MHDRIAGKECKIRGCYLVLSEIATF
jgi:hypothetical protein